MNTKNQLSDAFKDFSSGGLERYDDDSQALIFKLQSNGGPRENEELYLKFNYVEYFHLPISFDAPKINGYSLDEIKVESESEAKKLMPKSSSELLNYKDSDYRCYRFYANNTPSPYYIYCLSVESWVED